MTNLRTAAQQALEQPEQAEPVEIKPPNPEGATQCIVRWMAETPAGWVGAWDRAALAQFVTQPRRLTDDQIGQIWFAAKIPGLTESDARRLIRAAEEAR